MPSAADIRAGGAFVELYSKNGPLYAGLHAAQKKLAAFGAGATKLGQTVLRYTAMASAPLALAIKAGSDMQETMNKFNVVFGQNAERVKAWGDEYAAQVGRSKQQIADFLAGSQDLFVPMGFDAASAEQISKTLTALAVDLASFNNTADADALRDLHAAMTGSGEVMKKYGVILSQTAVDQEMLNKGMDPKAATEQQKAQARLAIILRGTAAAQGDALRSSGSFANQMKALKAALWDTAGTIGAAILPAVTPLVGKVVSIAAAFGKWAEANKPLLVMIAKLVAIAGAVGIGLVFLGGAGTVLSGILGGLATIVPVVGGVLGTLATAFGFLVSPIGLVVAALAGLAGWWAYTSGAAGQAADWIIGKFGELMAFARDVFGAIADAMAAGDMQLAAEVMWAAIRLAWSTGTEWIRTQWAELRLFLTNIWYEIEASVLHVLNNLVSAGGERAWKMVEFMNEAIIAWQKTWSKYIGAVIALFSDVTIADMMKTIDEDYERIAARRRGTIQRLQEMSPEQRTAEIDEQKRRAQDAAAAKRDERIAAAQQELEAARRAMAEARDAAAKAKAAKEATATKSAAPMPAPPPGPTGPGGPGGFGKSASLFSAEGYKLLVGRENPALAVQKRMEQHLAQITRNTAKQSRAAVKEAVPPRR